MGLPVSLLLVAVGAILIWAVSATTSGVNLHTVGWILLIGPRIPRTAAHHPRR